MPTVNRSAVLKMREAHEDPMGHLSHPYRGWRRQDRVPQNDIPIRPSRATRTITCTNPHTGH